MRIETYNDPEYGTIAAARDDAGNIIATATDTCANGVRIIHDEGELFRATGGLLIPTAEAITAALYDDPETAS